MVFAQLRRFWYETALAAGPSSFGSLEEVADPQRIVFGSDWPYCPGDMADDMIAALGDEQDARRQAPRRHRAGQCAEAVSALRVIFAARMERSEIRERSYRSVR